MSPGLLLPWDTSRGVYAACVMLSVSAELLKLWVRNNFFANSFQCCKFGRDLASGITSGQCMECWETLSALVPLCCVYIMEWQFWCSCSWVTNEPKLLEAEILPSDSYTCIWYNRHTNTSSVSPNDSVMNVGSDRWHTISCTWNIILSSASSCVQLSLRNEKIKTATSWYTYSTGGQKGTAHE